MGCSTKLNLLTIGLIFLTAVAITSFYSGGNGATTSNSCARRARIVLVDAGRARRAGLATPDKAQIERMIEGIAAAATSRTSPCSITHRNIVAERRFSATLGTRRAAGDAPTPASALAHGGVRRASSGDRSTGQPLRRAR